MFINKLFNNNISDIVAHKITNIATNKELLRKRKRFSYISNGYILIIGLFIVICGLVNTTEAGTCWIKKMDNGKCKELFSKNMSKEECCKNSQEFAYTLNELSDMEYFFAMAIGDGHSCASCLDSCDNAKCAPGKRCVIRKGQPKCICAPICKASAKEKRKHHHKNHHHQNNQQNYNNNKQNRLFNSNIRKQNQQNKLVNFDNFNSPPNREIQHLNIINIQKSPQINNYQQNDKLIDSSIESSSTTTTFRTFKNQRNFNSTKNKNHRSNSTRLIDKLINNNNNNIKDTEFIEHQNDDTHHHNNHLKHNEKFIITANDELLNQNRKLFSQNLGNLDKQFNKNRKKKNMNHNSKNILIIQTSSSLNNNHQDQLNNNNNNDQNKHHNNHRHQQQNKLNQLTHKRNRQRKIKDQQLQLTNTNHIVSNGNLTSGLTLINNRQHQNYNHQQNGNYQKQKHNNNNNNNNQISNRNITNRQDQHHHQQHQDQHNRRQKHQQQQQQQQNKKQQFISLDEKIRNGFFNHGFPNPEFDLTQEEHQMQIYHGGYANPVCGNDGRTYRTECQLKKRACRRDITTLSVAYRGHCQTSCKSVQCLQNLTCVEDQYGIPHCIPCEINCPYDDDDPVNLIDPRKAVCGVDGRTYKSVCDINRQVCITGRSIAVAYHGVCKDELTCSNVHCGSKMICLTDLITHKPRCVSCSFKCPRKRRSQLQGDRYVDVKICGNNNHTYHSWCHMRRDSCNTELYIDIKHIGACHKGSFPKNLMDPYAK